MPGINVKYMQESEFFSAPQNIIQPEVGGLLWAKPADELSPLNARAYLHRPAVVSEVKQSSAKVFFLNHDEDIHPGYLPGSILRLPPQWVPFSSCVSWDTGSEELLRQKERHVKRVLEERCQLWIIDCEYQRARDMLQSKQPVPAPIAKALKPDIIRKLKTKGRFKLHPVGKIRKISAVSSRGPLVESASMSEESEVETPPPKKRAKASPGSKTKSTPPSSTSRRSSFANDEDSDASSVLDEAGVVSQVRQLTDAEVESEWALLTQGKRILSRIADSDHSLVDEIAQCSDSDFIDLLASVRLVLNAGTRSDLRERWRPLLSQVGGSIQARVSLRWPDVDPLVQTVALRVVELISKA